MKLLHMAFIDGNSSSFQFLRKVDSQFRAIKTINPPSQCRIIGENHANLDLSGFDFQYVDLKHIVFLNPSHSRQVRYRVAAVLARALRPRIVYCRYPWADVHLYRLVREFPNFVFEHQTKETPELRFNLQKRTLRRELAYGQKVLTNVAGIVAVSEDYLAYELERAGGIKPKPGHTMANGVDVEQVSPRNNRLATDGIHILCLASFCKWHGYDRLINGIYNYKGKEHLHVHMVGTGPELERYRRLVKRYALDNHFTFHGRLERGTYQHIVEQCHIAIGALGLHRMDLHITASLKNREYCAMGIPFVYSGQDSDFDSQLDFLLSVPPTDNPLDMETIIAFIKKVYRQTDPGPVMRQYAETRLSWDVKVKGLVTFLETLSPTLPYPTGEEARQETIETHHLFTQLLEDKELRKAPPLERRLTQAGVARMLGQNENAAGVYRDVLEKSREPGKYLFRLLVELEQLLPEEENLIQHFSRHVTTLYAKRKRLDYIEAYRLASLYKKNGDYQPARNWFEKALVLDHRHTLKGGIHFHLGEISLQTGDKENARQMFRHCLAEIPGHQKARQYLENL